MALLLNLSKYKKCLLLIASANEEKIRSIRMGSFTIKELGENNILSLFLIKAFLFPFSSKNASHN